MAEPKRTLSSVQVHTSTSALPRCGNVINHSVLGQETTVCVVRYDVTFCLNKANKIRQIKTKQKLKSHYTTPHHTTQHQTEPNSGKAKQASKQTCKHTSKELSKQISQTNKQTNRQTITEKSRQEKKQKNRIDLLSFLTRILRWNWPGKYEVRLQVSVCANKQADAY